MELIESRTASKLTLLISVFLTTIGMFAEYGNIFLSDYTSPVVLFCCMWFAETILIVMAKPHINFQYVKFTATKN